MTFLESIGHTKKVNALNRDNYTKINIGLYSLQHAAESQEQEVR